MYILYIYVYIYICVYLCIADKRTCIFNFGPAHGCAEFSLVMAVDLVGEHCGRVWVEVSMRIGSRQQRDRRPPSRSLPPIRRHVGTVTILEREAAPPAGSALVAGRDGGAGASEGSRVLIAGPAPIMWKFWDADSE